MSHLIVWIVMSWLVVVTKWLFIGKVNLAILGL